MVEKRFNIQSETNKFDAIVVETGISGGWAVLDAYQNCDPN
ncbi:hypothetical protein [Fodinibius saliphilus]|nr:hypothetical protein [Fodinibius saliphilus]